MALFCVTFPLWHIKQRINTKGEGKIMEIVLTLDITEASEGEENLHLIISDSLLGTFLGKQKS